MNSVMFVDDDTLALQLMLRASAILGQPPRMCNSALQGLEIARNESPRLILVDQNMHDMTGLEFIQRLKSDPQTANIPVILVSASQASELEYKAMKAGASGFLEKPISLDDLADIFNAYMS